MLQPNRDRLDYGTLLMPPEGFQLDHAIATSYSLDLDTLISIPVALYFAHSLDLNIKQDVVQVLDSIRRASDTVRVFCQKGQICVPDNQHRLYSFIESCVVQVPPTHKDSFHPKIWVIRYSNSLKEVKYRLIVLSRNLTFDRSWDIAFQMDGDSFRDRSNNFRNTKPLVDFINYLGSFEKISWIKSFVADLGKTEFKLTSNEFEDFKLMPSGFDGYQSNTLFRGSVFDELLIISPFLTNGGLEVARNHSSTKPIVFSREFELKRINKDLLSQFSAYHLSKDCVDGEEKIEVDTEENLLSQPQDLHAKLYSVKSGWDAFLYVGSANCSKRAMDNNVEFMIQLRGKNSKIGPQAFLQELINDELKVFQRYSGTDELTDLEKRVEEHEQILQAVRIELVNAPLKARANIQDDGNYQIEIDFNLSRVASNPQIEAAAYLLRSDNQKNVLKQSERNVWIVHNIAELDLSCFMIIDLRLKGSQVTLHFAIKTEIANLPASRSTKIFRDIISNTANFLKYIRFLLADDYWEEQLAFPESKESRDGDLRRIFNGEEPIYENLLKAASRQPERLVEIKNVMDKLSQEESKDKPIIPDDFRRLWDIFDKLEVKK